MTTRPGGRPPAVLYVASGAELYGADMALLRTVTAHVANGGIAAVALPSDGPLRVLLEEAGASTVLIPLAVLRRRLMRPTGLVKLGVDVTRSIRPLVRLGRDIGADIVHSNTTAVISGAAAARVLRRPHVWSVREDLGMRGGAVPAFLVWLGADRVVAMSESVRLGILARQPRLKGRTRVVVDGVDTERFSVLPTAAAARQLLGLDLDRPVVAMAARIKHWKGQWLLVESLAAMGHAGEGVQLLLAGDVYPGDEVHMEELLRAIARAGAAENIHLPGFVSDTALVFAAADVLAAPSTLPEPLGLAVIDALTAGVPVVASAHGGHLETVRHGVDGLLVAPGDGAALGQAIGRLLGDEPLRLRLGEAARRDRARFDWERGHERLAAVYAELFPLPQRALPA